MCLLFALAALLLTVGIALAQGAPVHLELAFSNHLDNGLAEQDAYIERTPGSGQIWRVSSDDVDAFMNAPLYTTLAMNKHDPFDSTFNGPFLKGQPLGLTLAQWLTAKGSATYDCDGTTGVINASFQELVPNAIYTLWYFFVATPPMVPFPGAYDLPVGARDGTENIIHTDVDGNSDLQPVVRALLATQRIAVGRGIRIGLAQ